MVPPSNPLPNELFDASSSDEKEKWEKIRKIKKRPPTNGDRKFWKVPK